MAGMLPNDKDNFQTLWKKIAWNMYQFALASGASGLNPPSWNDSEFDLKKKIAYYTAATP